MTEQAEKGEWPCDDTPISWAWVDFKTAWTDFTHSKKKVKQREYSESGKLPVVDQGDSLIGGHTDDVSMKNDVELPCVIFGDHTRAVKFIDFEFAQGADGVKVLKPGSQFDPQFAFQALRCVKLPDKGYSRHFKFLKATKFPVPPLPEQRRIVTKLNRISERSAAARDHLTRVTTLATRAKQAILAFAFRGQLTSEWRSSKDFQKIGNEMVEDLREQRRAWWISEEQNKREAKGQSTSPGAWTTKYRALEVLRAEGAVFDVPKSWAWVASEEVVAPGAEIVYGIVQPGPKLDEGVPYVRGLDIVDGVIKTHQLLRTSPEIALKYARASLTEGDILLGIIRATKVAVVPKEINGANITQGTARFRPSNSIRTKFLARWLEGPDAQKWLHSKYRGIDMPGLNLRDVRRCPVPLAPIEEQDEIIRRIETAFARIDRLTEEASRASHLLDRLDERLLVKAFQGELVPQDPDDEPAEALLERIREARAAAPKPKRARKKKASVD